jgi:hypothetical protein
MPCVKLLLPELCEPYEIENSRAMAIETACWRGTARSSATRIKPTMTLVKTNDLNYSIWFV